MSNLELPPSPPPSQSRFTLYGRMAQTRPSALTNLMAKNFQTWMLKKSFQT